MVNLEIYWAIVNHIMTLINTFVEGYLFYVFLKPFVKTKLKYVCILYVAVMSALYLIPFEIIYAKLIGIIIICIMMCLLERVKVKQKVFLSAVMYLLRWVVYGITLVLRDLMFRLFINTSYMLSHPMKQLITYIIVEGSYYIVTICFMYLVIKVLHKVYVNKREDISTKELLLLFSVLSIVMLGDIVFSMFSKIYVQDVGVYIWNRYPKFSIIKAIYQLLSFTIILIAIVIFQRLKENQREEKESLLLVDQIENIKLHISSVENLFEDIKALKHDMGNHITILENLYLKNENEEFKSYLDKLKLSLNEKTTGIKTGNPVTDIILKQRQKEAEDKKIEFVCDFVYPAETNVNAFDISVILNNAINNAFEGVIGCENPYVSVVAFRNKNAYMLEVTNSIVKNVEIDDEIGLPLTTKNDKHNHGFGLANIRKVAQKYYGDIDIYQQDNYFMLTVMLMLE
ncbi:MAG: GHKL domain-containing protein [Erysipelotrichales bacterium]|nr:GHKL domain-containing protein [Erysipelotrichales bacterium]